VPPFSMATSMQLVDTLPTLALFLGWNGGIQAAKYVVGKRLLVSTMQGVHSKFSRLTIVLMYSVQFQSPTTLTSL
jgi:hypothetical protein